MQTVDELLSNPPAAPAFEKWFEQSRELRAKGHVLKGHLTIRLSELREHIGKLGDAQVLAQTVDSGVTYLHLTSVEAWLIEMIEAEAREPFMRGAAKMAADSIAELKRLMVAYASKAGFSEADYADVLKRADAARVACGFRP